MWSSDQYRYLLDCDPGQPGWGRPPTYRLIVTFDVAAVTVRCAAALRQRHVSIALPYADAGCMSEQQRKVSNSRVRRKSNYIG